MLVPAVAIYKKVCIHWDQLRQDVEPDKYTNYLILQELPDLGLLCLQKVSR